MKKQLGITCVTALLAGATSSIAWAAEEVRIDVRAPGGEIVTQAECVGANDNGRQTFPTGRPIPLRPSSRDLLLVCTSPAHGVAIGALRAGQRTGYPRWVELVFEQVLVFNPDLEPRSARVTGLPPELVPDLRGAADPMSHACMQRLPGAKCRTE